MPAIPRIHTSPITKPPKAARVRIAQNPVAASSARNARRRTTSAAPKSPAITARTVDSGCGTSRIALPRTSVSSALAWISTPGMSPPPANAVAN